MKLRKVGMKKTCVLGVEAKKLLILHLYFWTHGRSNI